LENTVVVVTKVLGLTSHTEEELCYIIKNKGY